MKTLIKPLLRIDLEKPAAAMPGSTGLAERITVETDADLCLDGYRMLLHCQGASSDAPRSDLKQEPAHRSHDGRNH
jgi:hypothetical protein